MILLRKYLHNIHRKCSGSRNVREATFSKSVKIQLLPTFSMYIWVILEGICKKIESCLSKILSTFGFSAERALKHAKSIFKNSA